MAAKKKPIDKRVAKFYQNKANSCKSRKIDFQLSKAQVKELLSVEYCAYTGVKLTQTPSGCAKQALTDLTLERVDCSKGYTLDNTIVVCHAANMAKAAFESVYRDKAAEAIVRMSEYFRQKEKPVREYSLLQKAVLWMGRKVGVYVHI